VHQEWQNMGTLNGTLNMPVIQQKVSEKYVAYCGDCISVMEGLPEQCIDLSIYSPPFGGLFCYSSAEEDLSNCKDYGEFFLHYEFVVQQVGRLTKPGRMTCVHCMDVPSGNSGLDYLIDFPGDIIRLHEKLGWRYVARYHVWKEPLGVRNRTMTKALAHKSIVEDSSRCTVASADYLLVFRRSGKNAVPIAHPVGLLDYAGSREIPKELLRFRGWKGNQIENRYSHWIWRQYASAFWDDVRIDRVLPYRSARDAEDEKHIHPLQLDVIDRCVHLWSNPNEAILTPFAGVGSEAVGAVMNGRRAIAIELKKSYYSQMLKNLESAERHDPASEQGKLLFGSNDEPELVEDAADV
jgi:DNA modification methylase